MFIPLRERSFQHCALVVLGDWLQHIVGNLCVFALSIAIRKYILKSPQILHSHSHTILCAGHPIVNDIRYGGTSANPRQVTPIPPTEDIMYTPLHSSIPSVPDPVDYTKMQWCEECEAGTRDTSSVNRDDLASTSICLHALSYACNQPMHRWRFEVPRPDWAI